MIVKKAPMAYEKDLSRELCKAMDFANLPFSDWFPVLTALKSLGFSQEEVRQMCSGTESYNPSEFDSQWKAAASDYDLSTIIGKAKIYAPNFNFKDFYNDWSKNKKPVAQVSRAKLQSFPFEEWRGLSINILKRLNCSYSEVRFPSAQKKLPAVVIPNDLGSTFARSVEGKHHKNIGKNSTTTIYLPDSDSFEVVVVEGAINGASILQAISYPNFGIIASGGTSGNKKVLEKMEQIKEQGKQIRVLIAYDNDSNQAGQKAAEKLREMLIDESFAACTVDITKTPDVDLNDVLQHQGEKALADMVNSAISKAQIEFSSIEEKIKDTLRDAPIKLELPEGFFITAGKLKFGTKNVSYTPPLVTKKFWQGDKVFYEVAFLVDEQWKKITVPALSLYDRLKLVALSEYGLDVNSLNSRAMCTYFVNLIGINESIIPVENSYSQGGWTDDACKNFVYPNDEKVFGNNFDYTNAFKISGNEDKFKEVLLKALKESYIACLVIGTALAAPLIKPLAISSKQLHLGCRSGSGKTAVVKLALSIFGNPKFLMSKFNATANALENFSVALNDFPSAIDELQSINKFQRDFVDELLYNYENGRIRGRLTRQGNFQPFKYFNGSRITTGEQPLTNEYSNEGAKKRCVEITENKILREDLAIEIHQITGSNCGFQGRLWVEYIKAHTKALQTEYNAFYKELYNRNRRAFSEHISLVAVAQVALQHFCTLIFDKTEVEKIVSTFDVEKIFAQLPQRQEMQNGKRAISSVAEFYARYGKYFPTVAADGSVTPADHPPYEVYGYQLKNGNIFVLPNVLKNCLKEYPNFQAIVRDFSELGYLDESKRKDHPHQRKIRKGANQFWGYVFKGTVLFDRAGTCERKAHEEIPEEEYVPPKDDGYSYEED